MEKTEDSKTATIDGVCDRSATYKSIKLYSSSFCEYLGAEYQKIEQIRDTKIIDFIVFGGFKRYLTRLCPWTEVMIEGGSRTYYKMSTAGRPTSHTPQDEWIYSEHTFWRLVQFSLLSIFHWLKAEGFHPSDPRRWLFLPTLIVGNHSTTPGSTSSVLTWTCASHTFLSQML